MFRCHNGYEFDPNLNKAEKTCPCSKADFEWYAEYFFLQKSENIRPNTNK
jgi:hypothetical protein